MLHRLWETFKKEEIYIVCILTSKSCCLNKQANKKKEKGQSSTYIKNLSDLVNCLDDIWKKKKRGGGGKSAEFNLEI